jgi:hypothetical protein
MSHFGMILALQLGFAAQSLGGCGLPAPYRSALDPLALQAMQTREFQTSKERLFAATVSVFQDMGFVVQSGDLATGLITCKSPTVTTPTFGAYLSVTVRASAFIEVTRPGFASIRCNVVESRSRDLGYGANPDNDTPNEQPQYYETLFNRIEEAVFVRTGLDGSPQR